MSKQFLYLVLALLAEVRCPAQQVFLSSGKIEFERRINQYARMEATMDANDESWKEFSKKVAGNQFKTDYFDLTFARGKTFYQPGRETTDKPGIWFVNHPAQDNIVFADLERGNSVSVKKIFEQTFLIADTLRKIKWKITDETRPIAGFNCRRANALIMDSIYVVAFYTDEILTSGGPESFSGLPGMILGVALPHQHITWFATRVEAVPVQESQLAAPVRGKKITIAGLTETMQKSMKDWGKEGRQFAEDAML